jgi:hypothetical protein
VFFDKKERIQQDFKPEIPNSHHFSLGDKALSLPKDEHYRTEIQKNYI